MRMNVRKGFGDKDSGLMCSEMVKHDVSAAGEGVCRWSGVLLFVEHSNTSTGLLGAHDE